MPATPTDNTFLIIVQPILFNPCDNVNYSLVLNVHPPLRPNLENIIAAGQNPVKAACNRFAPTKAVKANAHGVLITPRSTLIKIKVPAIAITALSTFIPDVFFACMTEGNLGKSN